MSEIASALDVSMATATGVVDRLVERELVLRENQPEDRRVVLCRLSDKGEKLIGGLWQLARDRARELLGAIEPSKLQLVTEALEALRQSLRGTL
jgi:DNA-binding MarR family transcriptional regulator